MRFILSALLLALASAQNLIQSLPGNYAGFNQTMYSGYLTVNATHGRNLFHILIESQRSPASDPLVLWLTGGPGCSGLSAMLSEMGPFFMTSGGSQLRPNPYTWTQTTNMIFVESPSGVGFSYSNTAADYNTGDAQTTGDLVAFMHQFLLTYPQYQGRDFWITGESYAGHYVPITAQAILNANAAGQQPHINLVGTQVGNAWTMPAIDNKGAVDFWKTHALISETTWSGILQNCDFSNIGPLSEEKFGVSALGANPTLCQLNLDQQNTDFERIDIYEIFADVCLSDLSSKSITGMRRDSGAMLMSKRGFPTAFDLDFEQLGDEMIDQDPCIDDDMTTYFNRPEVKQAIHATTTPFAWEECNQERVQYSYHDVLTSVLPVYQDLLTRTDAAQLQMLVYSGDIDGIVPVTGTRQWLYQLAQISNLQETQAWRKWIDAAGQTGGFTQAWTSPAGHTLQFATVRDAGMIVSRSFFR